MSVLNEIESLKQSTLADLRAAPDLAALDHAKGARIGPHGKFTALMKQLGTLPKEEKPAAGKLINAAKLELEAALAARREELELKAALPKEPTDFTARSLVGASPIRGVGFVAASEEPPIEGIPLIGGLVIDTNGLALAEVGVELSGADHRTTNTSATGEFLFDSLSMNGTFTLRPDVGERIFDPISIAVSNLFGAEFAVFVEQALEPLPMPVLSIGPEARFDGQLVVTWPGDALDYVLEYTVSLSEPDWQPVVEQQLQDVGQVLVPLDQMTGQRFLRLRSP